MSATEDIADCRPVACEWGSSGAEDRRDLGDRAGQKVGCVHGGWNPDPAIARAAERLYGHIDNLDCYTGLQCETTVAYRSWYLVACWLHDDESRSQRCHRPRSWR
jgi:hypothetical protein